MPTVTLFDLCHRLWRMMKKNEPKWGEKMIERGGTFNGKRPEMVSAPDQINFLNKSSFEIAQKSMLIFILDRERDGLRKFER